MSGAFGTQFFQGQGHGTRETAMDRDSKRSPRTNSIGKANPPMLPVAGAWYFHLQVLHVFVPCLVGIHTSVLHELGVSTSWVAPW